MLKKLTLTVMLFCILSPKNISCDTGTKIELNKANLVSSFFEASIYALSALIAYGSHKLLNKNTFYREKLTPVAEKACFLLKGTGIINRTLMPYEKGPITELGKTLASGVIAYNLNNILNKNDFYREEINPFAKKVCLFYAGTTITFQTIMLSIAIARLLINPEN